MPSLDSVLHFSLETLRLYNCEELIAFAKAARQRLPVYDAKADELETKVKEANKSLKQSGAVLATGLVATAISVAGFFDQSALDHIATVLAVVGTIGGGALFANDSVSTFRLKSQAVGYRVPADKVSSFLARCETVKKEKGCQE